MLVMESGYNNEVDADDADEECVDDNSSEYDYVHEYEYGGEEANIFTYIFLKKFKP